MIKKNLSLAILMILIGAFVLPIIAQKQKSKDELYKEIATLSNTKKPEDMERAYQLSKEFILRFPKEKGKEVDGLKVFIKRFRERSFYIAFDEKKYAEVYSIGKEILVEEPDNISITLNMGYAGYDAVLKNNDKSFADDASKYSKRTLDLFEAGNIPSSYSPFKDKPEALAWMYYVIGFFATDKDIKDGAVNLYKSTLYESGIKSTSQPYIVIAYYYESLYEKMSADLSAKIKAKAIDDAQVKAENEKINIILDQMVDAYCRAYKFGVAEKNPAADEWKKRLKQVYLFQKKPEPALESFITYTVSTPLKDPGLF